MEPKSRAFKSAAKDALQDATLQGALKLFAKGFPEKRRKAVDALPEFDALREAAVRIKDHTLNHLDRYLEQFADKVEETGGRVHFCRAAEDARKAVLSICREHGAKTVTKGKSMVGEEIALSEALEAAGITPIETDLGEYILQLAKEPPSHIIGPALHKTKEQVSDLFLEHHAPLGFNQRHNEGEDLVAEARKILRDKYFAADVGITGANFLVAETGSAVVVTNEGNGDLTMTCPKTHIVITSIEKLVPNLADMTVLMRLLARSATGQAMSVYTTLVSGPKRDSDLDGPENFHVILLDGGRADLLGTEQQALLRCIKCGACMNHCPVYGAVGGHAYGWVYPGPVGAALNPVLTGLNENRSLPEASTLCGACEAVCPVKIPLPAIFRHWRNRSFEKKVTPLRERLLLKAWAFVALRPGLYRTMSAVAVRLLGKGKAPFAAGWTGNRDLPKPEEKSFHAQWQKRNRS